MTIPSDFPQWLQGYVDLRDQFDYQYGDLLPRDKGHLFAKDVSRLIPYTNFGALGFRNPEIGPESHDGGVDIIAENPDDASVLFVQSKYSIPGKDEFSQVISKFHDYYQRRHVTKDGPLFAHAGLTLGGTSTAYFQIVTMQRLEKIIRLYEESQLPSRDFYQQLKDSERLEIVDGSRLLGLLQTIYRLANIQPAQFDLAFEQEPIAEGNVLIGVLSSNELQRLYRLHGNALFLENVRPFLGSGDGTSQVNAAIIESIKQSPELFLGRNNGVVFRAKTVEVVAEQPNTFRLTEASVVNGCQTTMCLVNFAKSNEPCHVVAKIVATDRAWDVAKAANLQNVVNQFELEVAQVVRQQVIEKLATDQGYRVVGLAGASELLDTMHRQQISYDELRALFIGLVSRKPNNIFQSHLDELLSEMMSWFGTENLLLKLFQVQSASVSALEDTIKRIGQKGPDSIAGGSYQRYFKDDKGSYRAFMTLLASAAMSGKNLWSAKTLEERQRLTIEFLDGTIALAESDPRRFAQYFRAGMRAVNNLVPMSEPSERFMQSLNNYCRRADETRMIEAIKLDIIEHELESEL